MKKINYIAMASLAAAITVVSCSKEEMQSHSKGTVLKANIEQTADTKTNMSEATEGATNISVVWTAGDKLSVLSGASYGTNNEFTLNSGDEGKSIGSFTGPTISGEIIAVYPYSSDVAYSTDKVTLNIPQTQAYTNASFAQNSVPMVAKGTVGTQLAFKYLFSAIAFKVNGSGKNVTKVTVTATTPLWGPAEITDIDTAPAISMTGTDSKYNSVELNCATAQDISSDKVFYIAVPVGTYTFAVNVYCGKEVFHTSYTTAKTFTAGNIKYNATAKAFTDNGPAYIEGNYIGEGIKANGIFWAPVNCGYEPETPEYKGYKYGKLYQWGRKNGQGYYKAGSGSVPTYEDADYPGKTGSASVSADCWNGNNGEEAPLTFYKRQIKDIKYKSDWIINGSNTYWNLNEGTTNPASKNMDFDPCPSGWRVPTVDEFGYMAYSDWNPETRIGTKRLIANPSKSNDAFDMKNGLTIIAAGFLRFSSGEGEYRSADACYWSSGVKSEKALYLHVDQNYAEVMENYRAYGYSVRCVQE